MRIDWAVACRYAESDGHIATIVGAGVDVVQVAAFPAHVAVMLAVRLAASAEELEAGQEHEVVCHVLGPSGEPVLADDGTPAEPMKMGFSTDERGVQQLIPDWLVNPLFAFQIAWLAAGPGSYTIETNAGDDTHRSPVHVVLGAPTPA